MLIAQITDLHVVEPGARLLGEIDTNACLARCVARLQGLQPQPDLVLITGDLVNDGTPAQYAHLRALLAPLAMPLYVLPGNHDSRAPLRNAFSDHTRLPTDEDGPFLHHVVEAGPLRVIMLDTVVAGETGGRLCPERLAWLDARLSEAPHRPTLIAMHHPPFVTGIPFMDRIGLEGAGDFAALIARFPNVERITCGHVHRPVQARVGGTVAGICPSTAHQIYLTFDDGQPDAWVGEPPAFQLHLWHEAAGLLTHTVMIEERPAGRLD